MLFLNRDQHLKTNTDNISSLSWEGKDQKEGLVKIGLICCMASESFPKFDPTMEIFETIKQNHQN